MTMNPQTKTILGYVGIGIAAALITAAAVWAVMNARVQDEVARVDAALEQVADLESEVDSLSASLAAAESDVPSAASTATAATTATAGSTGADTATSEKQFCFMMGGTWEGETPVLAVDYAQMLSGTEAAAAATADGAESPPPNDYYIVNDNPKIREFPADKTMVVKVTSKDDGVEPQGYDMPFGQWYDILTGGSGSDFVRNAPYWITIEDGTIVAIEEQFLP